MKIFVNLLAVSILFFIMNIIDASNIFDVWILQFKIIIFLCFNRELRTSFSLWYWKNSPIGVIPFIGILGTKESNEDKLWVNRDAYGGPINSSIQQTLQKGFCLLRPGPSGEDYKITRILFQFKIKKNNN